MRPRRAPLSEEDRRNLMTRRAELGALSKHPSWPVLEVVLEDRRKQFEREVLVTVLGGSGLSTERQAFIRGFFKGMAYVLAIPENAEARLEEFLKEEAA